MPRLGDEHTALHAHDPHGLAQDHLDLASVPVELSGELDSVRAGLDRREVDGRSFGLGHDFLGDDQDVIGLQRERARCSVERIGQERAEVVADTDLGDPLEADHPELSRHAPSRGPAVR